VGTRPRRPPIGTGSPAWRPASPGRDRRVRSPGSYRITHPGRLIGSATHHPSSGSHPRNRR